MIDQELLQAIEQIVAASEERTNQRMDAMEVRTNQRMEQIVAASEERTNKRMDELCQQMTEMKAYMESDLRGAIDRIADGHAMLAEKMSRIDDMANDIEEIKGSIVALEASIVKNERKIIELERARG